MARTTASAVTHIGVRDVESGNPLTVEVHLHWQHCQNDVILVLNWILAMALQIVVLHRISLSQMTLREFLEWHFGAMLGALTSK